MGRKEGNLRIVYSIWRSDGGVAEGAAGEWRGSARERGFIRPGKGWAVTLY